MRQITGRSSHRKISGRGGKIQEVYIITFEQSEGTPRLYLKEKRCCRKRGPLEKKRTMGGPLKRGESIHGYQQLSLLVIAQRDLLKGRLLSLGSGQVEAGQELGSREAGNTWLFAR